MSELKIPVWTAWLFASRVAMEISPLLTRLKKKQVNRFLGLAVCLVKDLGFGLRDQATLERRVRAEGLSFLTKTLPLLGKAFDRGLGDGRFILPSNCFKSKWNGSQIPAFGGALFAKVFCKDGSLRKDADPMAVSAIRQLCYFFYKVKLPFEESAIDSVCNRFVQTDEEIRAVNSELDLKQGDPIMEFSSHLIGEIFSSYDRGSIRCGHGPGAVSNGRQEDKWTGRLTAGSPVYENLGRHFWLSPEHALHELERHPIYNHAAYFDNGLRAKVILVPKDSRGPRLICCEPIEHQFIQQGLKNFMYDALERSPLTRGQVNFTDQSVNQRQAFLASTTHEVSTLDLKDASDRISLSLVKRLFSRSPSLLKDLLDSRTDKVVLPNGRTIKLAKFAPMGSACCFPVLATCIYALLTSALVGVGYGLQEACASLYVYGDDIIVPSAHAEFLIEILHRYGLRVNVDKSFIRSDFAESCGKDYFRGNECTPTRLRADLTAPNKLRNPADLAGLVETANHLMFRGYSSSSEWLYCFVERRLGPLPYGMATSPYICRVISNPDRVIMLNELTPGLTTRPGSGWDKGCLKAWTLVSQDSKFGEKPYMRLLRTLPMMGGEIPLPEYGQLVLPRSTSLRKRWFTSADQTAYKAI